MTPEELYAIYAIQRIAEDAVDSHPLIERFTVGNVPARALFIKTRVGVTCELMVRRRRTTAAPVPIQGKGKDAKAAAQDLADSLDVRVATLP